LETKANVFEDYLFQIQMPSFEKFETKFIVKNVFCGDKLFSLHTKLGFPKFV